MWVFAVEYFHSTLLWLHRFYVREGYYVQLEKLEMTGCKIMYIALI